jgi:uncharacterized protein
MSTDKIQTSIANPSPLGLLGFGMTTILLNLHNANIIPLSIVILSMGFALGGSCQIIAGIMEFFKGNTFGATAFTAYGFFWLSLIVIWTNPTAEIAAADEKGMGFYLLLWGIFTACMYIGTLKHNRATQVVFLTLAILFFMLSIGDFAGSAEVKNAAGFVGILCGASAVYNSMAQLINGEFGKTILPM